jgi:hypothetical protein
MAASLYDTGRNAFATGGINWTADTIKVALLGASYTPNMATDQFYSTISANVIGTPVALANKTASAGVCDADDVTTGTLTTGSTITQLVIYKDTGTAGTSQLIAREDTVSTPTNGGTITISWDNTAGLKIFKL